MYGWLRGGQCEEEQDTDRPTNLPCIHSKHVLLVSAQETSRWNIRDVLRGIVDDQCVAGDGKRVRRRCFHVARVPGDRARLFHRHVRSNGVCGGVEGTGGQHIDGSGSDRQGGVVPLERDKVPDFEVLWSVNDGGRDESDPTWRETRVDRGRP